LCSSTNLESSKRAISTSVGVELIISSFST
jgi:hypothetical protein